MNKTQAKTNTRKRRHARVRAKIAGSPERPRLSIFISNKHIYAQVIDDVSGRTLASATDLGGKLTGSMRERAATLGEEIAKKAQSAKISTVVFDRGGFSYRGRVKEFAEAARKGGLTF